MITFVFAVTSLFAQMFSGTWTCHSQGYDVPWVIAPAPGSAWTTVRWGDQRSASGGIAYVGYIAARKHWVYQDFHYDGSYATNTAVPPAANSWLWVGTFFRDDLVLHGAVRWTLASPKRIKRTFEAYTKGALKPTGRDYCTKR